MNAHDASRRRFLQNASAGFMAAAASGGFGTSARGAQKTGTLAVLGGSPVRTKPFSAWPPVTPEIEQSVLSALRSRSWGRTLQGAMQGAGQVVELEKRLAGLVGAKWCLATGSCTQALHTALHAVGVAAGDEVLVNPCTFIATVQSILMCNALPVFVDVDLDTFQMDAGMLESLITADTRAIEPVHIAGLPCDMDPIIAVARKHDLRVVEDAAQALLAEYKGKKCGTFGDLGCVSFQSSKQLACGEGGAIFGNDEELIEKCYVFHNMGLSGKPGGISVGTKYRMHELEAAVLLPQLATIADQTRVRNVNARYLAGRLAQIPGIAPQKLHEGTTQGAYYLCGFRYQKEHFNDVPKDQFLRALRAEGISGTTTMYFDQLNKQPFIEQTLNSRTFQKIYSKQRLDRYRQQNHCPRNDRLSAEGVWFGQQLLLGEQSDMDDIADAIAKIHDQKDQLARSSRS
ncbi:MAG: DegT/DnrJ/EryC1/StrS family aminotransferase [Planctomycetes bacterium]|nr:DegT/DnrJ/EryC1/StrS family aminotransferase [Planctomycetota bacterium]